MSSVEERKVILTFENGQFEKNSKQSMSTLEKLDDKINGFSFGKSLGKFGKFGEIAERFNLDGVTKSIDKVNKKFNLLGIAGGVVLGNLATKAAMMGANLVTAIPRQILEGGRNRALNIQQARFQLQGLFGKEADGAVKIKEIFKNASEAVDGTAYSLDSAAKAAAQLAASGIQAGDEMRSSLRGVTGLASMTGSSFDEISRIFATVAGNGRLMGVELQQIGARGINAAATIAQYVNNHLELKDEMVEMGRYLGKNKDLMAAVSEQSYVTESDIRQLVSTGVVSYKIFAGAMEEAFGDQATRANETYTGSLENLKSALSRIGEKTQYNRLLYMTKIFNALRVTINAINGILRPFQWMTIRASNALGTKLADAILLVERLLKPMSDRFGKYVQVIDAFLYPDTSDETYAEALQRVRKEVWGLDTAVGTAANTFSIFDSIMAIVGATIKVVIALVKTMGAAVKAVYSATLKPVLNLLTKGLAFIMSLLAKYIGRGAMFIDEKFGVVQTKMIKFGDYIGKHVEPALIGLGRRMKEAAISLAKYIKSTERFKRMQAASYKIWDRLLITLAAAKKKIVAFAKDNAIYDWFRSVYRWLGHIFQILKDIGGRALDKVISGFERLANGKGAFTFSGIWKGLTSGFDKVVSVLSKVWDFIKGFFTGVFDGAAFDNFKNIFKGFDDTIEGLSKNTEKAAESVKKLANAGAQNTKNAGSGFMGYVQRLLEWIRQFKPQIKDIPIIGTIFTYLNASFGKVGKAFGNIDMSSIMTNTKSAAEILKSLASAWMIKNLGSMFRGLGKTCTSMSGMFDSVSLLANKYSKTLKYQNFKALAIGIALIAASVAILAMVPAERLWPAVAAMSLIVGGIIIMMKMISNERFNMKNLYELTVACAALGGAMLAISVALRIMEKVTPEAMLKFTLTLGVLVGAMYALSAGGAAVKTAGSVFVGIGFSALMLAFAIKQFDKIKLTTILEAILKIGLVLAGLTAIVHFMPESRSCALTILAIALAVNMLVPPIIMLGAMPFFAALQGVAMLGGILLGLAFAFRIIGAVTDPAAVAKVTSLTLILTGIVAGLFILSTIKTTKLLTSVVAIVAVLAALVGALIVLTLVGNAAPAALIGIGLMTLVFIVLGGALYALSKIKMTGALAHLKEIGNGFKAIAKVFIMLGVLGPLALAGTAAALLMIPLAAALAAGLTALGALSKIPGLKWLIKSGISLLKTIGEGIGSFAGGIVNGFAKAATEDMPKVAERLSKFMENLKPFISGLKEMKSSKSFESVEKLTDGIGDLKTKLVSLDTALEEINMKDMFIKMGVFVKGFAAFANEANEIPEDSYKAVTNMSEALGGMAEVASAIPPQFGIKQLFTGMQSLTLFATDLMWFMPRFKAAIEKASEIPEGSDDILKPIKNGTKSMVDLAITIQENGLDTWFRNTLHVLSTFADDMVTFIPKFKTFYDAIAGENSGIASIDAIDNNVEPVANATIAMATAAKAISDSKPSYILGTMGPMNAFATDAVAFIPKFIEFVKAATEVTADQVDAIQPTIDAVIAMAEAQRKIPKTSFGNGWFGGQASISEFANKMKDACKHIKETPTDGITDKADTIITALNKLIEAVGGTDTAALATKIQEIQKAVTQLVAALGSEGIKGGFKDAGAACLNAYAEGLGNTTTVSYKSGLIKQAAIKGVQGAKHSFKQSAVNATNYYKEGLTSSGVYSKGEAMGKKASRGASSSTVYNAFKSAGRSCAEGFITGMKEYQWKVNDAAAGMANKAYNAAKAALAVNSPSKRFMHLAHSVGEGFVKGMIDWFGVVYNTGTDLANEAISATTLGMQDFPTDIGDPVIRPVLDLDELKSGLKEMDTLMQGKTLDLSTTANLAASANPEYPKWVSPVESKTATNIVFEQNNYSPKALSRLEIYRQTRNQLSQVKEILGQ